jgi:hypothetical protein
MFSVIEYFKLNSNHPNKDVIIHYYTNNKQKAVNYISGIANIYKTEQQYTHVIDITQENNLNNLIQAYSSIGQYVTLLTCIRVDNIAEEDMAAFKHSTLKQFAIDVYGIPLLDKYQSIQDETIEGIPLQKRHEICAELAYYSDSKQCVKSDKVFAVIELQEL